MIGLYRVPETENLSSPLDAETQERLWKITLHNFPPDYEVYDGVPFQPVEVVILTPRTGRFVDWIVSLANFEHPENALYIIGPDNRDLRPDDIPQQLQEFRTHHVFIPNATPHSMWGHVAWAVTYWDRIMKEKR